ncbi:MAG TPA: YciI family protein [Candidatus Polarisedimenticolia bacterium]|nr:YciI family protein [Candidatus Polarisedimenticolia bacterium]
MKTHPKTWRRAVVALLFVALFSPASSFSGDAKPPGASSSEEDGGVFIIRLRPAVTGREATELEKLKIIQHFEYLKGLLAQGKLILAGLATDDYAGVVILRARDRLEAEKIMAGDPAIGANVFLAELHPFRVALLAAPR